MTQNLFAIMAFDAPDTEALRAQLRDGHLAHFKTHAGQIAVAGPMGKSAPGSLIILEADSEAEARAFIEGDPFHAAGVWERIEISTFKAGIGKWVAASN